MTMIMVAFDSEIGIGGQRKRPNGAFRAQASIVPCNQCHEQRGFACRYSNRVEFVNFDCLTTTITRSGEKAGGSPELCLGGQGYPIFLRLLLPSLALVRANTTR